MKAKERARKFAVEIEGIDVEAAEKRFNEAAAELAKAMTCSCVSLKEGIDHYARWADRRAADLFRDDEPRYHNKNSSEMIGAKTADELEIGIVQEPQEPEAVPCGWAECHGEIENLFPPGWWRWPMTERRSKWLADNWETLSDASEALPPRRPGGEMILFADDSPFDKRWTLREHFRANKIRRGASRKAKKRRDHLAFVNDRRVT